MNHCDGKTVFVEPIDKTNDGFSTCFIGSDLHLAKEGALQRQNPIIVGTNEFGITPKTCFFTICCFRFAYNAAHLTLTATAGVSTGHITFAGRTGVLQDQCFHS